MMMRLIAVLLLVGVFSAHAQAAEGKQLKGTLYELNSNRQKRLYTWEMRICGDVWTSTYRNLDGTTAVEDRVVYEGKTLVEYSYVRHRIGERSSVIVRGKSITFKYSRSGVSKTETNTTRGVFLTGPAVFPYLVEHLAELQAGKVLEFDYGVLDRLDYYSFTLSSRSPPGSASIQVEIIASSFFVRMAIAPIIVSLSRDGSFKGIAGRSILMELDDGRLRPIDADLVVEAETNISCEH
jgi:hypothetical protein